MASASGISMRESLQALLAASQACAAPGMGGREEACPAPHTGMVESRATVLRSPAGDGEKGWKPRREAVEGSGIRRHGVPSCRPPTDPGGRAAGTLDRRLPSPRSLCEQAAAHILRHLDFYQLFGRDGHAARPRVRHREGGKLRAVLLVPICTPIVLGSVDSWVFFGARPFIYRRPADRRHVSS